MLVMHIVYVASHDFYFITSLAYSPFSVVNIAIQYFVLTD